MRHSLVCALILIWACGTASAGPVTFFGEDLNGNPNATITHPLANAARSAFFANLSGVGTETFETILTGTAPPIAIMFPGAGTATLTGSGGDVETLAPGTTNGVGRFPTSGTNYFEVSISDFTIHFSSPIAAFGFYGTDIGDFGGTLTLTLGFSGGGTTVIPVGNFLGTGTGSPEDGSVLYFGLYDITNTYTSVTFNNNAAGTDFFGFDDFSVGAINQVTPSVPEPGMFVPLALGLAWFVGRRSLGRR